MLSINLAAPDPFLCAMIRSGAGKIGITSDQARVGFVRRRQRMAQDVLGEGRKRFCPSPTPPTTPGPGAEGAERGQNHGGKITCELPSATSGTHAFCVFKSALRLEKEGPRNSSLTLPFGQKIGRNFLLYVVSPLPFLQWAVPEELLCLNM